MPSLSNQNILKYIDKIPEEIKDNLLRDVCYAIQRRKNELIAIVGFDIFPDAYTTSGIKSTIEPTKILIAEKILGIPLRDTLKSSSQSKETINTISTDSTEAALQRVEELKKKYTPEQVAKMRSLRAEVEAMLSEFEKAEEQEREKVLAKYGITKFQGRRVHGDPVAFILDPKNGYARFLNVLFKAETRRIDRLLVDAIRDVTYGQPDRDPLLTEDGRTEMIAAGILGNTIEKQVAIAVIKRRKLDSDLVQLIRQKKRLAK